MAREAVAEIQIRKLIQWVHCENPEMIAVTVVLIAGAVVELKKMAHSILSRFRSSSRLHKRKRERELIQDMWLPCRDVCVPLSSIAFNFFYL